MTLQEIMERVGSKQPNVVRAYVNDGLRELEGLIPEKTTYLMYNITEGQKLYSMPDNFVTILGVYKRYRANSTGTYSYIKIPRVVNVEITDAGSATAADAEVDIIVV